MKIYGIVVLLSMLQGCSILGAVIDGKLQDPSSSDQRQNASIKTQRIKNEASLSTLGGEFDLAILNYALTGEKPKGSAKPQSCNDLSGTDKQNCINKVKGINEHIKKHVEKH